MADEASQFRTSRVAPYWAVLSGLLAAAVFPPAGLTWFAWLAWVPVIAVSTKARSSAAAFWLGFLAGLVCFCILLHPFTSASSWAGWLVESAEQSRQRLAWQTVFLHLLWIGFSLVQALSWGAWAAAVQWCGRRSAWRLLLAAPAAWVALEWTRGLTAFGVVWLPLGQAAADWPNLRQLAALGGTGLLSWVLLAANTAVALLIMRPRPRGAVRAAALTACAVLGVWMAGAVLARRPSTGPGRRVVVIQQHAESYRPADFSQWGIELSYLPFVRQAVADGAQLIVLPETVIHGTVSLDGSRLASDDPATPAHHSADLWDAHMRNLLAGSPALVALGAATVSEGRSRNSMLVWSRDGLAGVYHKRALVPFSEYRPSGWPVVPASRFAFTPGLPSQVIAAGELRLGLLICQEVAYPALVRRTVQDGASLLISGGDDGVWRHPAMAAMLSDAAQLRAVETGRCLIRAMKSGVSAIIDARGRELARIGWQQRGQASALVAPSEHTTPYVRWGDWIVWLSWGVLGWPALTWRKPVHRADRRH